MRRSVGIGAIQRKKESLAKFKEKGQCIVSENLQQLTDLMDVFRDKLELFASKHQHEIRKNPTFRRQFLEMCATVGVDPLASSKGFWSTKLNIGQFYYELAMQMIEVCMATAPVNGGFITMEELCKRVMHSRGRTRREEITKEDILKAAKSIEILGPGFSVIKMPKENTYLIKTTPKEISVDHLSVLQIGDEHGFVSNEMLAVRLNWANYRTKTVINEMLAEGTVWIDSQCENESPTYWFPSFFAYKRNS
ncbi:Vacuolar-sorting protein SNF8 [Trichinella pseudospiralis]|uniref:Vacuolar-sorting protein SNF8 n=1 Tax=Trichinella pseudospiralis TaxID=6337 RepID=A0A0V1G4L7_TRIPS|nr:Vacuolar-sorting protein SNF8 [Trichinella pseudospiralis]